MRELEITRDKLGKISALRRGGWSVADIAGDVHLPEMCVQAVITGTPVPRTLDEILSPARAAAVSTCADLTCLAGELHVPVAYVEEWYTEHHKQLPPRRPDTKIDPARARELYDAGATDREIAAEFGCGLDAVCKWRHKHGLSPNQKPVKLDPARAQKLYEAGATDREIAAEFGCMPNAVWKWRQKQGLPPNQKPSSNAKIDPVRARELYDAGAIDREIAAEFGCGRNAVCMWRQKHGLPPNRNR